MWKTIDLVKRVGFTFNSSNCTGLTGVVTDLQERIAGCAMDFLCEGRGQASVIRCALVSSLSHLQSPVSCCEWKAPSIANL